MDVVTHGLASVAVARAFFPRTGKAGMLFAVLLGAAADLDWISSFFGPASFLKWHRVCTHSVFAALIMAAVIPAVALVASYWKGLAICVAYPKDADFATNPPSIWGYALRIVLNAMIAAPLAAALVHIAMDACQSDGAALFWPFSPRRIALDWLPSLDPWILVILVGAVALPELLHLVSSEIGAKSKKPRGQTGAIIGLALVVVYIGVRATLHSNALAMMQSRTFHGETPRRTAAFPETLSLVTWHGIVETERSLNQVTVDVAGGGSFDPDTSLRVFKPEPSPELDAARQTETAARFLRTARFPKATVEKTEKGHVVLLRDLRFAAAGETQQEIAAIIRLDEAAKVTSAELIWARNLHQ